MQDHLADRLRRLFEDDAHSVVEIRTDSLSTLRELGPPDLVHLIKQPVKSANKQVIRTRDGRRGFSSTTHWNTY
jgi:predicted amino acid racemase